MMRKDAIATGRQIRPEARLMERLARNSGVRALCLISIVLLSGCTSVQTKVEISAPASAVRAVLFDFDAYPKWNPFITKIDGAVVEGNQILLTVKPVGGSEITVGATVLTVTGSRLTWRGIGLTGAGSGSVAVGIPGVAGGTHDFIIEEIGPGRTVFYNNEKFSGADIPFLDFKPVEAGFEAMNAAIKKRAEGNSN